MKFAGKQYDIQDIKTDYQFDYDGKDCDGHHGVIENIKYQHYEIVTAPTKRELWNKVKVYCKGGIVSVAGKLIKC